MLDKKTFVLIWDALDLWAASIPRSCQCSLPISSDIPSLLLPLFYETIRGKYGIGSA